MLRRSMLLCAWPAELAYRSLAETNNGAGINKPAGVAVGDLVVVVTGFGADPVITTASGDVWNKNSGATQRLFWKILTATDVANAWGSSVSNLYATAIAYSPNGPAITSVVVKSAVDAAVNATEVTIPGFPPSGLGRPRAVIAALSGSAAVGGGVIPPAGFTERVETGNPEAVIADAQREYNFNDVTFTGLAGTGGATPSGWLLEVH